ncbi:MAG: DUF4351 domain-containing protein [Thauera sp.]|jgi:hypothetical protein|nr:DUF4351 domain-containing protein [Thauera sp.]
MNTNPTAPRQDDYDSPWKEVIEHAFPEFVAFYFPAAWQQINWSRAHQFKNTELRQVVRDAELGRRFADALVEVMLHDGEERWVHIHVEIQGEREQAFAERMFTYNYRLFDRYRRPVASLAVLADQEVGWKPQRFGFELLGCRHSLEFPVAKLLDYQEAVDALEETPDPNPFALITAAHLHTRQTRDDLQARYQAKRQLVRLLYRHRWQRQRILDLFAVIDWMMRLPKPLEQQLWQDIEAIEGESKMRYVTSIERLATERGMQQGLLQGLEQGLDRGKQAILDRLLSRRFGPLDTQTQRILTTASSEQLDLWAERLLDAGSLDEVFAENDDEV